MKTILLTLLVFAMATNMAVSQQPGDISNVTDVDGNVYETVYLKDGKWWMQENLKVKHKADGTEAKFYFPWNGTATDESLVAQGCGLLYDRDMLLGEWPHGDRAQGLCPKNWHVPTMDEYEALERAYGGTPQRWNWDEVDSWVNTNSLLKIGELAGGRFTNDPAKSKDNATGFWDPKTWGGTIYLSNNTWGNKTDAHTLAMRRDGKSGSMTMDPPTYANNCRCVKNKEVNVKVTDITDNGLKIALSDTILRKAEQVKVYDVTDPTDPWMVEITSVVFSNADRKSITLSAYLNATAGNKYEVRFIDLQFPTLPLKGYELKFDGSTGIAQLTAASLKLFPNPATNELKINMDGLSKIAIFNIAGQEVLAKINLKEMAVINISGLQSGVYFIKATNSKGAEINSKFIKK